MILTIFGATGTVGKQLVKQALHMGHTVKAYGRNVYTGNLPENENLELVQGALFDEKPVLKAIKDSDAVLSVLGGAFDGADKTRSLGIKNIVAQMQKAGVNRIVAVGGMGVLNGADGKLILEGKDYPKEYLPVGTEHLKAYEILMSSSLDWTFVCPPDLVDAEVTGLYHTAANEPPQDDKYKINTGDLAMFMLNELQKKAYIKQRVGISN